MDLGKVVVDFFDSATAQACANLFYSPPYMNESGVCQIYNQNPDLADRYRCGYLRDDGFCKKDSRPRINRRRYNPIMITG